MVTYVLRGGTHINKPPKKPPIKLVNKLVGKPAPLGVAKPTPATVSYTPPVRNHEHGSTAMLSLNALRACAMFTDKDARTHDCACIGVEIAKKYAIYIASDGYACLVTRVNNPPSVVNTLVGDYKMLAHGLPAKGSEAKFVVNRKKIEAVNLGLTLLAEDYKVDWRRLFGNLDKVVRLPRDVSSVGVDWQVMSKFQRVAELLPVGQPVIYPSRETETHSHVIHYSGNAIGKVMPDLDACRAISVSSTWMNLLAPSFS